MYQLQRLGDRFSQASINCSDITRISSPGLYGAYPFIDYSLQYYGILARQGGNSTFTKGKELLDRFQS